MSTMASDSMELAPPPLKKQKTEMDNENEQDAVLDDDEGAEIDVDEGAEIDGDSGSEIDSVIDFEGDIYGKTRVNYLAADYKNDEWQKQIARFHYQWEKSEGFEIDWLELTYGFSPRPVVWKETMPFSKERSDKFVKRLTLFAIDHHNQDKGGQLELVKIVRANFELTCGQLLYITFLAKGLSSSNPEPILYRTSLFNEKDMIEVESFGPRPTDEEIASIKVDPPNPVFFPGKPPEFFQDAVSDLKAKYDVFKS